MKRWLKRLGVLLAVLLVAAAAFVIPTVWFKPWVIDHFYMRVLVEALLEDPLVITQLKLFEAVGLDFHADDLPDQTLAQRERLKALFKKQFEILESYDRDDLEGEDRRSYDIMHWLLSRSGEQADRFWKHPYSVNQLQGLHVRFPDVMVNYHLVGSVRDAENYLARVEKIGGALADLSDQAKALEKDGFTVPSFILEKIHDDAKEFADDPLEENPLWVDYEKKVKAIEGISDDDQRRLLDEMKRALSEEALPGYRAFADEMQQMSTRTSSQAGVWHLPDGEAWYQNQIEESTTTTMNADEIHRLGLAEVDRIQAEMIRILDEQGVVADTFRGRLAKLDEDPRFYWPEGDEGEKAIIAEYKRIIEEIESKLDTMFITNPKTPVDVEPVPEFKEKTAATAYYFPAALDGSKPGTFYANLRDLKAHKKWTMRTLAYHEAIPGHHFQLSVARAQDHLPLIRQLLPFTAYTEGWALYAEQVAAEHGFQEDPFDRIGYLDAQLFRAVRLVVDTGLHAKRWSRDRAVEYVSANTGMEPSEVEAEVDRYCMWPGQALGYMTGRLRILAVREKAKSALGDKFDLREFHDVVLRTAALPLDMLDASIDEWIANKSAAKPTPEP